MRDPSEVLEDDNFDPSSVGEIPTNTDNLDCASWTAKEMAEKATLVKTFAVLEGHRVHVDGLEWDEQLLRGQSRTLHEGRSQDDTKVCARFRTFCHGPSHGPREWRYVYWGVKVR